MTPGIAAPNAVLRADVSLLVKFRGGANGPAARSAEAASGHAVDRRFEQLGWQQIHLPPGISSEHALARYRTHPDVLAVEVDRSVVAIDDLPAVSFSAAAAESPIDSPDDPLFSGQWNLSRIAAPLAWLDQTGSSNAVVAVIDTGVNYLHEDLVDNLWRNPGEIPDNGIDDDGNGWVDDVYGINTLDSGRSSDPFDRGANGYYHGSLVAGIIGASAGNHRGVAGINWSVRIMAVRAINANNAITIGNELEALNYVLMMKNRGVNIRAVNMSYGGLPFSLAERDALLALTQAGILLCAAAGNGGTNNDVTPNYPSSHPLPGIIAVAASDESDHLAAFPFSGSSQYGRTNVDLAAPGLHVVSTFGPGTNAYDAEFFGTSAATPHVTGAVALLAAANPDATAQQIKTALLESVDRVAALTNKMVSHGRLNVGRALDHPFIAVGPPRIARAAQSQSVVLSNRVDLSPIVFGSQPRVCQWYVDGRMMPSATNATLTLSKASFAEQGDYVLMASNSLGTATSSVMRLTVLPLRITNQPLDQWVRSGSAATFEAEVESPVPVAYQWTFGKAAVPLMGATNATMTISRAQLAHDGDYAVVVSNRFGWATSQTARLTVLVNPAITLSPISQSVVEKGAVTLSVGFSGNPPPFGVQWLQGTTPRASNTVAAFQDFFVVTNIQAAQAGTWRVRVRNAASGNAVEQTFTLQILTDTDGDGLPDVWERAQGLQTNDVSDARLDMDGDGFSNREEFLAGTQPTNGSSVLSIASCRLTNGVFILSFPAASNHTYTVESRSDLNEAVWVRMSDVVATSTNRMVEWMDPFPVEPNRQFRIRTPRAP